MADGATALLLAANAVAAEAEPGGRKLVAHVEQLFYGARRTRGRRR
jgi:hypothetical protein